jgi:hypothetical protein
MRDGWDLNNWTQLLTSTNLPVPLMSSPLDFDIAYYDWEMVPGAFATHISVIVSFLVQRLPTLQLFVILILIFLNYQYIQRT